MSSFRSDRPIESRKDDRLGVADFVKRLVPPLLDAAPSESLVVGLYGPWGHGKSSALRLLEEALGEARPEQTESGKAGTCAHVVRFTPWLYGDVESLLSAFFATLSTAMGGYSTEDPEKTRALRSALSGLATFVAPAARLGTLVFAGPGAAAAAGGLVESAADALAGALGGAASTLDRAEPQFHDYKRRAAAVLESMADLGTPLRVVVLIDDLDRVSGRGEVLAMLRLVKLVADLPNITYVLAMDHDRVAAMLNDRENDQVGADFLDKIVQIPIHLPPIPERRLAQVLIAEACEIAKAYDLDTAPLEEDDEGSRIFRSSSIASLLRPLLRNLRDVTRVLNVFRFAATPTGSSPSLHVGDLLLVSTLQACATGVFDRMRRERDFLVVEEPDYFSAISGGELKERAQARRRERMMAIAGLVPTTTEDAARANAFWRILTYLFPRALDGTRGGLDAQLARHAARLCSPEKKVDGYFRLVAPIDEMPASDVREMFEWLLTVSDPVQLRGNIDRIVAPLGSYSAARRESLFVQLDDRAAAMSCGEAELIAQSLPVFAQAVAGVAGGQPLVASLAEHAIRMFATSEKYGPPDDKSNGAATQLVVALVEVLPALSAADYAESQLRNWIQSSRFQVSERQSIAIAGVSRSEEFFSQTPNVFSTLSARAAGEALLTWHMLSAATPKVDATTPVTPVRAYLRRVVEVDPSAISAILSIAAAWGQTPSLEHRSAKDVTQLLDNLVGADLLSEAASRLTDEEIDAQEWPELIRQYQSLLAKNITVP